MLFAVVLGLVLVLVLIVVVVVAVATQLAYERDDLARQVLATTATAVAAATAVPLR